MLQVNLLLSFKNISPHEMITDGETRWTTDGRTARRTTLKHDAFATCCWRQRHKMLQDVCLSNRKLVAYKCYYS